MTSKFVFFAVLVGLTTTASISQGQGNTFNPYGNSGYADYREYGNAMISNNPALPGQALLNNSPTITRPRANSFQQYANELDGAEMDPATSRRGSSGLPYYQAHQRLIEQSNRAYQANNSKKADREFYERQKQRDQDYVRALNERDPVKRSKLLRQVEQNTIDHPTSASRSGSAKPVTAPNPDRNTLAPSARNTAPLERRLPAPSPFPTTNSRRPSPIRSPSASPARTGDGSTTRPNATGRPAPDPSTIPVPPPR